MEIQQEKTFNENHFFLERRSRDVFGNVAGHFEGISLFLVHQVWVGVGKKNGPWNTEVFLASWWGKT